LTAVPSDIAGLWAPLSAMGAAFVSALPRLAVAAVVFGLFLIGGGAAKFLVQRATATRAHANVGVVIGRLAQWALLLLGVLVAVAIVAPSVKPANVVSVLGIGSVAIGFAFKDILQNFLAGILLLLREPFRVGDQIVFKDFEGTVEDIDTRATRLRTYDGRRVIIPNGEIYTTAVMVNTAFDARRSQYDVGIGYGDDIAQASRIMVDAMGEIEGVLASPAPDVMVVDLAGSSINLRARWWTAVPRSDVIQVKSQVLTALRVALTKAQIDLPFPTRVVLFHDQTDGDDGDRTRQREGWPAGDTPPAPRKRAAERAIAAKAKS
jgi:small conductance mechanosensitive channel